MVFLFQAAALYYLYYLTQEQVEQNEGYGFELNAKIALKLFPESLKHFISDMIPQAGNGEILANVILIVVIAGMIIGTIIERLFWVANKYCRPRCSRFDSIVFFVTILTIMLFDILVCEHFIRYDTVPQEGITLGSDEFKVHIFDNILAKVFYFCYLYYAMISDIFICYIFMVL